MDAQLKIENNEASMSRLARLIGNKYRDKLSELGLDLRVEPQKGNDDNYRLHCSVLGKNGRPGHHPEFVGSLTVFFIERPLVFFKSKEKRYGTSVLDRIGTLFTALDILVSDHLCP